MPSRHRGKPKLKLRDLSRIWPTAEEKDAVLKHLTPSGVPIVTAILGAALLEHELEELLRPRFRRQDEITWKELTSDNGPLGTFYMKIIAGSAFGIYDHTIKDGLNTVRVIRNVFAHSKKLLDFSHELIVNELKTITLPKQKRSVLYKDLSIPVRRATNDPEQAYISLCFILDTQLLKRLNRILTSKTRRLKAKIFRRQLRFALTGHPLIRGLRNAGSFPGDQTFDPTQTTLGLRSEKSPHLETKTPHKKGK